MELLEMISCAPLTIDRIDTESSAIINLAIKMDTIVEAAYYLMGNGIELNIARRVLLSDDRRNYASVAP